MSVGLDDLWRSLPTELFHFQAAKEALRPYVSFSMPASNL